MQPDRKLAVMQIENTAEWRLTRQAVAFLSHGNVADAFIIWVSSEVCSICDVIEVLDAILCYHIPVAQGSMTFSRGKYRLPGRLWYAIKAIKSKIKAAGHT